MRKLDYTIETPLILLMKLKTCITLSRVIVIFFFLFSGILVQAQDTVKATPQPDTTKYSLYRIMQGHRVAQSKWGELNIRPYTYFRYLNQTGIDKTYTDGFGKTQTVDPRQDIQLQ